MNIRRANSLLIFGAMLLAQALACRVHAAFVYETPSEFFTSADFNGDGAPDVLVFDKLTGNARVGYFDGVGNFTWSAPMVTGVENVSGCAAGHFKLTARDVLVVTATNLNRVQLYDLSNTNASTSLGSTLQSGLGPHALASLSSPFGSPLPPFNTLLIASSLNDAPAERLDIVTNFPIGFASSLEQVAESGSFQRANDLLINPSGPSFAAGLVRGTNDTLDVWQFTNTPSVILSLSNLPPGSDYVFGNFNGESLPRFIFYQPGGSNLSIFPVIATNGGLAFGAATTVTASESVQQVFYLQLGSDGRAVLRFSDGVQGMKLSGGTATFTAKYNSGGGASGNVFTGIAPLANGQFVLFDAPAGGAASLHEQLVKFDGTNFTQISSANLSAVSARSTRANVWLFQLEPFVNRDAGFIASVSAPDWSDSVSGLTAAFNAVTESDAGTNSGLGSATGKSLGTSPIGATNGLPNQYNPAISVFSYSAPRAAEPVSILISPPPGAYPSPITISLSWPGSGRQAYYRDSPGGIWQPYSAPFLLTNDATIQYYGAPLLTAGRSQIQFASYTVGKPNLIPPSPVNPNPGNTNVAPVLPTNAVVLSDIGTIFYGRVSTNNVTSIWAINLDGSGDTYITSGFDPRVSRDGRRIAFSRGGDPFSRRANIWMRDMQTGIETQLFANNDYVVWFDWDTDSASLLTDYYCGIWDLAINGSGSLTSLISGDCYDDAPVRNPVDGRIAFHNTNPSASEAGLYVANSDGSGRHRIVSTALSAAWPSWSADGTELIFSAYNAALPASGPREDLWVVHADGSGLTQLTSFSDGTNGFPQGALWSPDGSALVGAATIFGTNGLWVVPLDAAHDDCNGAPIRLPTTPGDPIDVAGSIVVAPPAPASVFHPGLYIRHETNAVVVYWSTNYAGYTLEYTTNVGVTAWNAINGPYYNAGYFYEHWEAQNNLAPTRFFRLHLGPTNLVFNGSFESTNNATGLGITSLGAGSAVIPGWTTTSAELAWLGPNSSLNPMLTAYDRSDFLDLTGYHDAAPYGGVFQTIPTVTGQAYHLSFALGSSQYYDALYTAGIFSAPGVTVSLNGTPAFTAYNNFPGLNNYWQVWGFDFLATSAQTTMQFSGVASNRVGYIGLDDVVLSSSVPPPVMVLNPPAISNGQVNIAFNLTSGAVTTFSFLQAQRVTGPWVTNQNVMIGTNLPGVSYLLTLPQTSPAAFYRLQTP